MEGMVNRRMEELKFYKGRRVLVTGHTGFKGSWLSYILTMAGAEVTGYALEPSTDPSLFQMSGLEQRMVSIFGDIRDFEHLNRVFAQYQPEIVFHLAAQPIVREAYSRPRYTYETNVIGTVNICECIRCNPCVRSFLNVTTDKVYENHEWEWGYRETDALDGYDPYSNSKTCSELVTRSYIRSFYREQNVAASTARAGNVIGGGDFAADRIIPDCIRAAGSGKKILVRNPYSTRPYQHVLEPLYAYLRIAEEQYLDGSMAGAYNIGPGEADCVTTGELVSVFCEKWGDGISWFTKGDGGPHEAGFLKLDCSKMKKVFGWKTRWDLETAVEKCVEWTKEYLENKNICDCMERQILEFLNSP